MAALIAIHKGKLAASSARLHRINCDIEAVLFQHELYLEGVKLSYCHGYRQCHSTYCVKCASRCAFTQRRHLLEAIPALLGQCDTYQLWYITAAAADSPDVRASSLSAVSGIRKLLKHARLRHRVVGHFSAVEIAEKPFREHPCVHVHTLVVTKPMDKGKYRISRKDWIGMWETVCPQHRKRLALPTGRRRGPKPKEHASIDVRLVPRARDDIVKVIRYCTKWADGKRISDDFRRLLAPQPQAFLDRIKALRKVTRYFGPLRKSKKRRLKPCMTEAIVEENLLLAA